MKSLQILTPCTIVLLAALTNIAQADPVGTEYSMELTLFEPTNGGFPIALERHLGTSIPFDQTTKEGALVHIAPNPDVDNDLNVTEMVTPGALQDQINIWIEGKPLLSNGGRVPMFTEAYPQDGDMVRFDLDELYWKDFEGKALIDNLHFVVTFPVPTPAVTLPPTNLEIGGLGTQGSPLSIRAEFDAFAFDLDGSEPLDATDFHVSFTVTHIPEPATLALAAIGVLALVGFSVRRLRP